MAGDELIRLTPFADIDLQDPFFDSLKEGYKEFEAWFGNKSKQGEKAYVMLNHEGQVQAFLYLKEEVGQVCDIEPPLNTQKCLKVGTFKIVGHGTKLGERFVKKIFDQALVRGIKHIYVTVFEKHEPLIAILVKYGFVEYGAKETANGVEKVFLKDFNKVSGSVLLDYPVLDARRVNKWLLAVKPEWHTRLFPDSILKTESSSIVADLSHSNSIHKAYIAFMDGMEKIKANDVVVIYRPADVGKKPWFSSVATSLCVVEEVRARSSFSSVDEFIEYSRKNSVFSDEELKGLFLRKVKNEMYVVRMTYNVALPKRPNMKALVESVGLKYNRYWGFGQLDNDEFRKLIDLGEVYEGIVIN